MSEQLQYLLVYSTLPLVFILSHALYNWVERMAELQNMEERKEKYDAIAKTRENIALELSDKNLASPEWIVENVIMNLEDT